MGGAPTSTLTSGLSMYLCLWFGYAFLHRFGALIVSTAMGDGAVYITREEAIVANEQSTRVEMFTHSSMPSSGPWRMVVSFSLFQALS